MSIPHRLIRKIYKLFLNEVIKPNFSKSTECPDVMGLMKMIKYGLLRAGHIMFKYEIFDTKYGKSLDWFVNLKEKNKRAYNRLVKLLVYFTSTDFTGFSLRMLWLFMAFVYSKGWWKKHLNDKY